MLSLDLQVLLHHGGVLAGRLAQKTLACDFNEARDSTLFCPTASKYLPAQAVNSALLVWHKKRLSALMKRHEASVIFSGSGSQITAFYLLIFSCFLATATAILMVII